MQPAGDNAAWKVVEEEEEEESTKKRNKKRKKKGKKRGGGGGGGDGSHGKFHDSRYSSTKCFPLNVDTHVHSYPSHTTSKLESEDENSLYRHMGKPFTKDGTVLYPVSDMDFVSSHTRFQGQTIFLTCLFKK